MNAQLSAQPVRLKNAPLGGLLKRCFDVLWAVPALIILKTIPAVCALRGSY
ncbi:hypothetical protein [Phyllobacterium endophyticum]|uniref:hypothetical protein n=1 Tax=Phyllobacterium endophyticum TaxID=1149773 RepID=UPI001650A298|nr:hypothetical protein [Phyllobacterium endophyticum]